MSAPRPCVTAADVRQVLFECQVKELDVRLLDFNCSRHRRRVRSARYSGARTPSSAGIDQQPEDRIRHSIERSNDSRKFSELVPRLLISKGQFEDHSPPRRVPFPALRAIGHRRFDEPITMSAPPTIGRDVGVLNLDGQPEGHAAMVRLGDTVQTSLCAPRAA